jgi:hypothetical protein
MAHIRMPSAVERTKVPVRYDPYDAGTAFVRDKPGAATEACLGPTTGAKSE